MTTKPNNTRSKLALIAIVAIAILPIAAATLLYVSGWKPGSRINNGELITPPRPVTDIVLQTLDHKAVDFKAMHGKWVMVYVDASACLEACPKTLHAIRQIHTSLGKEADRMQRVYIALDSVHSAALQTQSKLYPDMQIWVADAANAEQLSKVFNPQHKLYLVDPLGNVMMQYTPQADSAGIRKDLNRLLSYSWTG